MLVLLSVQPASGMNPDQPASFEALARSTTDIQCFWLPAQNCTGYLLFRNGKKVANIPSTSREYDDSGLNPNTTYNYILEAERPGSPAVAAPEYTERTFAKFPSGKTMQFDVVVVQASSAGVAAAIEAARHGMKTALIEPTTRLGGMPVNGLCATDLRHPYHACGFFVQFQHHVQAIYASEGLKTSGLEYEPHVAQQAMKQLLYSVPDLTIYREARLSRVDSSPSGRHGRRRVIEIVIDQLNSQGGPTGRKATLKSEVFVDATDCGDLASAAHAQFRLGREARSIAEPHAGVIYYDRQNNTLLSGSTGIADNRVQSYAYLLVVKDYGEGADKTIPMPAGYNKEEYVHTPPWKDSWAYTSGSMPGGKYELNQHPQGNDLQGINYRYALDNYKERAKIENIYRNHVLGYLYYIQTALGLKQLGLPDDEFRSTGGIPPLLYVREARRIMGQQMPNESQITNARKVVRPESIGVGDYPMDSHAVEPKRNWNRPDNGEGEFWLYRYTPWHELPLGIIVPKKLDNVFMGIAVSATHVAFETYRLELVRMEFGEAAGIAAALCVKYHIDGRDIPAKQLQNHLIKTLINPNGDPNAELFYYPDVPPGSKDYFAIQFLAARGFGNSMKTFEPDAPTTRGEFSRWMTKLAARAAPPDKAVDHLIDESGEERTVIRAPFTPYMGWPINQKALAALQSWGEPGENVTRAQVANWLARVMNWRMKPGVTAAKYNDLTDSKERRDAAILMAHQIDSMLWDGYSAIRPDNKLAFLPDAPLSHAAMFETLFIAQIGLGPLFYDNPVDGRNGRKVPPPLFTEYTIPPESLQQRQ